MIKILGFDISTSVIGFCLLDINDDFLISYNTSNVWNPPKEGLIFERLDKISNWSKKIIENYKPDYICIEDISKFMKGKSNAQTIIMLALVNRIIGLESFRFLKKNPELFNVLKIRHGLKLNKILPQKSEMPELVAKHLGFIFPYKYDKKNKIKIENYDEADSIAVALYYSFLLTNKIKSKPINKKVNKT